MNENVKRIFKEETASTNDDAKRLMKETDDAFIVVSTGFQRHGRGQADNRWESEKDANILFSIGMRPSFLPVSRQFLLLQVGAVALCRTLETYGDGFSIKWPNDIYYKDSKISGTLIESVSCGRNILYSVLGCGVNVNQEIFVGDAPNPISLCHITGRKEDTERLFQCFLARFLALYQKMEQGESAFLQKEYRRRLYRREGWHVYSDAKGRFEATFHDVSPEGVLTLKTEDGGIRKYAFKEVTFII